VYEENTHHHSPSPPFADTAFCAYIQYTKKWVKQTTKTLILLLWNKTNIFFTSHLCTAGNFKPPSVHYLFRTMKQISKSVFKSSKLYWAAGLKPENSW
jgi:hypothetical protein